MLRLRLWLKSEVGFRFKDTPYVLKGMFVGKLLFRELGFSRSSIPISFASKSIVPFSTGVACCCMFSLDSS